jgi:hypothetical protein
MPESKCIAFWGCWDGESGGCDLHPGWFKKNPRYVVVPTDGPLDLTITLKRVPAQWHRGLSLDNMIGFYILAADDEKGTCSNAAKSRCAESSFVPLAATSTTVELKPSPKTPAFLIVPCTYGKGRKGSYQLGLSSPSPSFTAFPFTM